MPNPKTSIILPCLNEEKAVGFCLDKIEKVIEKTKLNTEIVIVDNGSTDNSRKIVKEKAAKLKNANIKLVRESERGYGAAYFKGFQEARGKYIFMVDCDATYDFSEIPKFDKELEKGSDFVIGNRFKGKIEEGAMSFSRRYMGNPLLSGILRLLFKVKIGDVHCGMRAIKKEALEKLNLRTTGMEFASEMIIKAVKNNLKIKEVPINYYKRKGSSKLKPFADGWKHLRFMLLYSPLFLFFIPGIFSFLIGLISMFWLYLGSAQILGIKSPYHPLFLSSLLLIIGYQLIIFALFAKTYAITHLGDKPVLNKIYKYITIEKASIGGALVILSGIIIYFTIFSRWLDSSLGELQEVKNSIIALTLIIIGIQTIFSSFMLSILGIKEK